MYLIREQITSITGYGNKWECKNSNKSKVRTQYAIHQSPSGPEIWVGFPTHLSRSLGCLHTVATPVKMGVASSTRCARMISSLGHCEILLLLSITSGLFCLAHGHKPYSREVINYVQGFTTATIILTPISWPIKWSSSMMNNDTSWTSFRCLHLLDNMSQCSGVEIITLPYKECNQNVFPLKYYIPFLAWVYHYWFLQSTRQPAYQDAYQTWSPSLNASEQTK